MAVSLRAPQKARGVLPCVLDHQGPNQSYRQQARRQETHTEERLFCALRGIHSSLTPDPERGEVWLLTPRREMPLSQAT